MFGSFRKKYFAGGDGVFREEHPGNSRWDETSSLISTGNPSGNSNSRSLLLESSRTAPIGDISGGNLLRESRITTLTEAQEQNVNKRNNISDCIEKVNIENREKLDEVIQLIRKTDNDVFCRKREKKWAATPEGWDEKPPPLLMAVIKGSVDIVSVLVREKGVEMNDIYSGENPMHVAAQYGHVDVIKLLDELHNKKWAHLKRFNENERLINTTDKFSQYPLQNAVMYGRRDAAEALIVAGADVNLKTRIGRRGLMHLAAERGHCSVMQYLLTVKRDRLGIKCLNQKDSSGRSPLHLAAQFGKVEAVKVLLCHKADVHAMDKYGKTPKDLADKFENTSSDLAEKGGYTKTVDILRKEERAKSGELGLGVKTSGSGGAGV